MSERAHHRAEHLDALHRSLDELVGYAFARQIKLGIENRPTHEIAGYAEIGEVLAWYDDWVIGYWHDTGHAQVQADLGFTSHIDWLRAYGHRIIGLHLHDAVGSDNHRAPGSGHVDWTGLASCVPADALRIIEVDNAVSVEQLRAGVNYLQKTGWVKK
jgi:sugar phosphate isomerase/epimerase